MDRSKRELSHPPLFSVYRWFWKRSKWERFISPSKAGFAQARQNVCFVKEKPGVYEFAISRGYSKRYKVYAGESGSIRKRYQTYANSGDHLVLLLDAALRQGCTVWMRCKYVRTKARAVAWETYFLNMYDYAWNAQQNQRRRKVSIVLNYSCMCLPQASIVEEPFCTAASIVRRAA